MEGESVVTEDIENTEILNEFFSSEVKSLRIPGFRNIIPLVDRVSHPTLKAILKFQSHPSVSASKLLTSQKYLLVKLLRKSKRQVQGGLLAQ